MKNFGKDSPKETAEPEKKCGYGIRHIQCLILFVGIAIAYSLRVNLNIAIVAMMDNENGNRNFEIFDWEPKVKPMVLSSFYWGYVVNQLPGGQLSKMYGSKYLLLTAVLGSSMLTLLTPILTVHWGWQALIGLRISEGLVQGVLFPSTHSFLAQWVPVEERPRLGTFCYSGVMFGTAVMLAISGSIASSSLGWPGIFYISGSVGILWSILWLVFGSSRPSEHRTISSDERQFIEKSLGLTENSNKKHIPTPWFSIIASRPFLALLCAILSQAWGFLVLLTEIPSFMHHILEVDIKSNGIMSALPYFAMWLLSYPFIFLCDFLFDKDLMSVGGLRKLFNTIGSTIPAAAIIGLAFITKDNIVAGEVILIVTVGLNAANGLGSALNHIDLAPNHAGVMMGMTNGTGGLVNILAPIIFSLIVRDEKNQLQWQIVFFITAAILIVGNLLFVFFGTAEEQEWNNSTKEKILSPRIHRRSSAFIEAPPTNTY